MRALITGCSTGIGRATAVELTKRGIEVIATARRSETLDDLDVAEKLALDVDDDASVAAAKAKVGAIDVLVNNAGRGIHGPLEVTPLAEFRGLLETNVLGVVRMIQAFLPGMREQGSGVIVNLSSVAGRAAGPLNGWYSATKFALEAISESLHFEVRHFGVRVVLIEPGFFSTSFQENRRSFGIDSPPYDELDREWEAAQGRLEDMNTSEPGPELVAQTIADAVEGKEQKLRWPVGNDAKLVIETRESMTFEEFEATMRSVLQLNW